MNYRPQSATVSRTKKLTLSEKKRGSVYRKAYKQNHNNQNERSSSYNNRGLNNDLDIEDSTNDDLENLLIEDETDTIPEEPINEEATARKPSPTQDVPPPNFIEIATIAAVEVYQTSPKPPTAEQNVRYGVGIQTGGGAFTPGHKNASSIKNFRSKFDDLLDQSPPKEKIDAQLKSIELKINPSKSTPLKKKLTTPSPQKKQQTKVKT